MYLRYFRPVKSISLFRFAQRNSTATMNDSGTSLAPMPPLDPQPFAQLWYPLLHQTMTETNFLTLLVDLRKSHRTHGLREMATMIFNQTIFPSNDRRDMEEESMAIIFAQILQLVAALLRDDNGVGHDKARYECVKTLLVAVEAVGLTPPPPPPPPVVVADDVGVVMTTTDGHYTGSITTEAATITTSPSPRYPPKHPKPSLHQLRQGPSLLSTLPPHPFILQGILNASPRILYHHTT